MKMPGTVCKSNLLIASRSGFGGLWGFFTLHFDPLCGVNDLNFGGTLGVVEYLAILDEDGKIFRLLS